MSPTSLAAESLSLRCRCGRFQADLAHPRKGLRAVCYCRDCQSYAHYLGLPKGMLDARGGTEVVIVQPGRVSIREGADQLACMSLSPQGTLRWYAACCRTPLGNTPRDVRIPHLGLVHSVIDQGGRDLAVAIGPVRMQVNRGGAHGAAPGNSPLAFARGMLRYAASMAAGRLGGSFRHNPFFDADGRPRAVPEIVSREQREQLRSAAALSPAG